MHIFIQGFKKKCNRLKIVVQVPEPLQVIVNRLRVTASNH